MRTKIKVYVAPCKSGQGPWNRQSRKLRALHELSDRRYRLTDSEEGADIILVGNVGLETWGTELWEGELIDRYPEKCFVISEKDHPLVLCRGIYASATKSFYSLTRARTGSYALYSDEYLNPYFAAHERSVERSEKDYLLSFMGRNSHQVRDKLFELEFLRRDILIEDTSYTFKLWDSGSIEQGGVRQKRYYDVMRKSKFALCPRGNGASSMRLFESLKVGVAPVILSDSWIMPKGPKWEEFSIVLKEKDVEKIESIVVAHEADSERMGMLARRAYETYFAPNAYFNFVVDNCVDILNEQRVPETVFWRLTPLVVGVTQFRRCMASRRKG